ncbi:hypothetical protein [Jeotgalibacillus marinus]|uniref:Uncharacterized protein n=1 Tax=Jeotgalibacillus marinus TaxID=86667 RepID=A0ABV3Q5J1_9BACL
MLTGIGVKWLKKDDIGTIPASSDRSLITVQWVFFVDYNIQLSIRMYASNN